MPLQQLFVILNCIDVDGASSAQTTVIPLLEREERALRDARAGLDGYDSEGNPLAESSTSSK